MHHWTALVDFIRFMYLFLRKCKRSYWSISFFTFPILIFWLSEQPIDTTLSFYITYYSSSIFASNESILTVLAKAAELLPNAIMYPGKFSENVSWFCFKYIYILILYKNTNRDKAFHLNQIYDDDQFFIITLVYWKDPLYTQLKNSWEPTI